MVGTDCVNLLETERLYPTTVVQDLGKYISRCPISLQGPTRSMFPMGKSAQRR